MGLHFRNRTNVGLQIVYAYSAPNCEGSNKWLKKGWYKVAPGNTVQVWSGWANGRKFFYYAEDTSGLGRTWSGEFVTPIPSRAFEWCWDTGSTDSRNLGLKKLQVPNQFPTILDYTINLQ
ncbi:DUF1036 domain-containing protein [Brevibacillus laterosporus]|uniref:DUF1036 domain-containing protein n=1 Tax=Brevibacillus laterosporus TaxID=1465 RepID=UPI000EB17AFC|nr:DUF1036 domain-containing protein [Brevibacillus laterosporus]AYK06742.1 DUF1036 domain-containing protein [Brevibacillus laterosporus]